MLACTPRSLGRRWMAAPSRAVVCRPTPIRSTAARSSATSTSVRSSGRARSRRAYPARSCAAADPVPKCGSCRMPGAPASRTVPVPCRVGDERPRVLPGDGQRPAQLVRAQRGQVAQEDSGGGVCRERRSRPVATAPSSPPPPGSGTTSAPRSHAAEASWRSPVTTCTRTGEVTRHTASIVSSAMARASAAAVHPVRRGQAGLGTDDSLDRDDDVPRDGGVWCIAPIVPTPPLVLDIAPRLDQDASRPCPTKRSVREAQRDQLCRSHTPSPPASCGRRCSFTTRRDWRGAENLPATGGFLACTNHLSYADPIVFAHYLVRQRPAAALPRQVRALRRPGRRGDPARRRADPGVPRDRPGGRRVPRGGRGGRGR